MTSTTRRAALVAVCVLLATWPSAAATATTPTAPPSTPTPSSTSARPTANTSYQPVPAEFSLLVSPTRITAGADDADHVHEITVVNRGQAAATVVVQERDFTGGRDGSLVFQQDAPYSASGWVTLSPTAFTVGPGATQIVTATVEVPAEPEAGDHQVAVVFLVEAGRTVENVRINRGVAAPIYVTVPGALDDSAVVEGLTADGFALGGPVEVSAVVRNTGTVHRDFRGDDAILVDTAGERAVFPDFTVSRGSTRDVSAAWDPPLFCVCHPGVAFRNPDGTVQRASTTVVVVPLHLIGIVLGAALLAFLLFRLGRVRYRAKVAREAARMNRDA
ncbi:hypothetical protein [Actinosynnema sp. NPDC020468]|uniref:hypothetical protein n=1 Tax=Actinosynnema sp. NPDC020468 TaxID=3154488 RepID=UPI0033CF0895